MMWDATRYGWSPIYYLTIEGIPIVWTEAALGLTLPTGYTAEAAALSLEASAIGVEQVDRQRGVAVTAPLSFALLDHAQTTAALSRWSAETRLTDVADYNDATLLVQSTAAFPASGSLYLGKELVTYSGKTATSFTGCTRGVCGLAYTHRPGTSGQTVTNAPRYWLGRSVTLWAKPCDQAGAVSGTALATDAVEVWHGRISAMPARRRDGFAFQAESLDRVLDGELAGKISGTIKSVGSKAIVDAQAAMEIAVDLYDAAGASVASYTMQRLIWPGSGYVDGDAVPVETVRARISTVWADWVTAQGLGAVFGQLKWFSATAGGWFASIVLKQNASVELVESRIYKPFASLGQQLSIIGGMTSDGWISPGWATPADPCDPTGVRQGVMVEFDDTLAADVTAPGLLRVSINGIDSQFAYDDVGADGALVYLSTKQPSAFPFGQAVGKAYHIAQDSNGDLTDLILRSMESSGVAGLRGTYDSLQQGLGYGIDDSRIAVDSVTAQQSLVIYGTYEPDGRSFGDIFGGALALWRRAIVGRVDDGVWALRCVSTDPGGTANADTLTDATLLAHEGDPVEGVERAMSPNSVTVKVPKADGDIVSIYNANADIEASGRREVEYEIPAYDAGQVIAAADTLVVGLFAADHTAQAAKLRVGPWVSAQVGDMVYLDGITHPALWDWASGTAGYTGAARVVGRMFDPVSLQVTLTVLLSGGVKVAALCPSMVVSAHGGTAAAPTSLTVPERYYSVLSAAVPCTLVHYRPGYTEATTETHTVSAVSAPAGGVCVLTVTATAGGHSIVDGVSRVTWPQTSAASTFQKRFSHVDDGTNWG